MIAGLFCAACDRMAAIYRLIGQEAKAADILARKAEMQKAIETNGWDGQWFLRAYDAYGHKVGSKESEEGRIFIESQGWCVLGGVGSSDGNAQRHRPATAGVFHLSY